MYSLPDKEKFQGIIYPRKGRKDPSLGPDALFFMLGPEVRRIAGHIRAEPLALNDPSLRRVYVKGGLSVCGPFLGAPHAVMGMEKMIALGAKRFWVLGWCGSIQSSLRMGDILLPKQAVSDEGTSKHYPLKGKILPSVELAETLDRALIEKKISCKKGIVWTTDAPYMETPEKVIKFRKRGAVAVEMEMSALMRVARFRGVKMAALLAVSDELFELKWRPGFSNPKLKEATQLAADCLLEAALVHQRKEDE